MSPEGTGLQREINKIFASGQNPVHAFWQCIFVANGRRFSPFKVLSIDVERLYNEQYSDRIIMEVAIDDDIYNHQIYPQRNALTVELTRRPMGETGQRAVEGQPITSKTYRAVPVRDASSVFEGDLPPAGEKSGLPGDIMVLRVQLVDPALEQIRLLTVGGIYRQARPGDVLRQILTQNSQALPVDMEAGIQGVDMVEPDNTAPQPHVIIPHGTPLVDLPMFLQEKYGIYSSGLGYYLQDGVWYVYPELRTNRFGESPRGLTIINVPENRFPNVERTYRTTANQVVIIATGDVVHADNSERQQQNMGNGVRFADSRKVMEGFSTTEGNKTQIKRGQNNSEYVAWERESGLNHTPVAQERVSANPYAQASRLARRKGALIHLKWENSEWGLLSPGMPVRFLYYENKVVQEAEGVLLQAHHYISAAEAGLVKGRHITETALTVFISNDINWNDAEIPA